MGKRRRKEYRYGWVKMTLRLDEPTHQKLTAIKGDRSVTDIIREAIEKYVG